MKRVVVVGAGYWGINLVRNFHELGALAGVCDGDPKVRAGCEADYAGCRTFSNFDAVLADEAIDAVAIAAPAEMHGSMVRRALTAAKDVFVEKPLCLSVEEGRELVELAASAGRILMVGHLLWYHPGVLKLRELVKGGALGRINYVYSNRLNMGKIRREENILWSFAPHDISVILGLLGEMPETVTAQGGYHLHQRIADVTVSLLTFPSGVKAHIFVSWLHPFKEQKLVIVGDRQMAVFDDMEPTEKLRLYPHTVEWKNHIPVANKAESQVVDFEQVEPLRAECLHFLECIEKRLEPRTGGHEGLRVLDVLNRCQEALNAGLDTRARRVPGVSRSFTAHESAFIDSDVEIGEGTRIWHVSHILSGSRVGRNCNIGQNVSIGPDVTVGDNVKIQNNVSVYKGVTIEDDVFCGPSVVFTNVINPRSAVDRTGEFKQTLVMKGATLGANSTIVCGATIGRYAFVGAGAVVTKDVADHSLVYGNPAVVRGWVCECGQKLEFVNEAAECGCELRYIRRASGTVHLEPKPEGALK